jgi:hypothetical protein
VSDDREALLREFEAAVEREAKLRKMEANLPDAISEQARTVRMLGEKLGLPTYRRIRNATGVTRELVTDALPGTVRELIAKTGLNREQVEGCLRKMRESGEVAKDPEYGGAYRFVERQQEAA